MDGFLIVIRCLIQLEKVVVFVTPLGISILDVNEYYEGEECYYSSYTDTSNPNNTNGNSVSSSFSHISKLGISTYKNPKNCYELIRKDNKNKVGVYCWFNLVNGKFYIGSSNHLHLRLSHYYKNSYYSARPNTLIVRALSRYGMENFSLIILEYTTPDYVINYEQKLEYNINPIAGKSNCFNIFIFFKFSGGGGSYSFSISPSHSHSLKLAFPTNIQLRKSYSTSAIVQLAAEKIKLNPWWLTGFVDGEGCFKLSVVERTEMKTGWGVRLFFSIGLHEKEIALLEKIQLFLGVGWITKHGVESVQFQVQSIKEIAKIIEHISIYPLITQKHADYSLWKKAFYLIQNKEHLTKEGLEQIVAIKVYQNRGLSPKLKSYFSNVISVERPLVENPKILDPNWLAGFTNGEGCFFIVIYKSESYKLKEAVQLKFILVQHVRDEQLMRNIQKYLDCGNLLKKRDTLHLTVSNFKDIVEKIIPFFKKYPIQGVKSEDFQDFCKVAELMKSKKHLTTLGLEQIRKIKAGMNTGRKSNKHTLESKIKMRKMRLGRKHSEETKQFMSESRKGVNNPFYGKTHSEKSLALLIVAAKNRKKLPVPGIEVEITDLESNITTTYESIRKAASAINSDIKSLSRREKSQIKKGINTPYRDRYIIVFKRP